MLVRGRQRNQRNLRERPIGPFAWKPVPMQLVGPQQLWEAGNGLQIQGAKEMVMFFGKCRRLGPPFHYFVCILDAKFCGRGHLCRKKKLFSFFMGV